MWRAYGVAGRIVRVRRGANVQGSLRPALPGLLRQQVPSHPPTYIHYTPYTICPCPAPICASSCFRRLSVGPSPAARRAPASSSIEALRASDVSPAQPALLPAAIRARASGAPRPARFKLAACRLVLLGQGRPCLRVSEVRCSPPLAPGNSARDAPHLGHMYSLRARHVALHTVERPSTASSIHRVTCALGILRNALSLLSAHAPSRPRRV